MVKTSKNKFHVNSIFLNFLESKATFSQKSIILNNRKEFSSFKAFFKAIIL